MSTQEAQNPQSCDSHSETCSKSETNFEEFEIKQTVKSKIKADQVSKLLNKFKAKQVTVSHILGDLARFDIETCLDEVAKASIDFLIHDQSTMVMNEVF